MGKKSNEIELVKGTLEKEKKIIYDWETAPKRGLEPWHLTTIALVLDVFVLAVYTFVNMTRNQLLTLGYTSHFLAITAIIVSYMMLKRSSAKWTQPVAKFSGMLNMTALFITAAVTFLSISLT